MANKKDEYELYHSSTRMKKERAMRNKARRKMKRKHGFLDRLLTKTNPKMKLSFELYDLEGFDLVVNATPVGMNDDPNVPFPTDSLSPRTLVADVITNPKVTPWLAAGLKKGCEVQYGAEMAYGQFGLMGRHMGLDIPDPEDWSIVIDG